MKIRRTASALMLLSLSLAGGLGGCASMSTGRERIVRTQPRCVDQTVQIYFEAFSAEVTKEGHAVITAAAAESRPCKVASVDVLGLSDNVGGTPDSNLDLSKRRAEAVTAALADAGLPVGEFKVVAVGEKG